MEDYDNSLRALVAAHKLVEVASRKGMMFVTDPETGSDKLIGFFVPAANVNELMAALGKLPKKL